MAPSSKSSSTPESVAARVHRNPRTASLSARTRLAALFAPADVQTPVTRTERVTPSTCHYMLRSMRRQA